MEKVERNGAREMKEIKIAKEKRESVFRVLFRLILAWVFGVGAFFFVTEVLLK